MRCLESINKLLDKINRRLAQNELTPAQAREVRKLIESFNAILDPTLDISGITPTILDDATLDQIEHSALQDGINTKSTKELSQNDKEPLYTTPIKPKRTFQYKASPSPPTKRVTLVESPLRKQPDQLSQQDIEYYKKFMHDNMLSSTLVAEDEKIAGDPLQKMPIVQRTVRDKFVVNLYESRPSPRWSKATMHRRMRAQSEVANEYTEVQPIQRKDSFKKRVCRILSVDKLIRSSGDNNGNNAVKTKLIQNEDDEDDDYVKLQEAAEIQCALIQQASKAIDACHQSKQFCNGVEKVLAEKILLLANYQHLNLMDNFRESPRPEAILRIGNVCIANLEVPLSLDFLEQEVYNVNLGYSSSHWFLVVANDGKRVLATEAVQLDLSTGAKCLKFNDQFEFESLDVKFEIQIDVFHLRMKSQQRPESAKISINQRFSSIYRSLRKLHHREISDVSSRIHLPSTPGTFVKIATKSLTLDNLTNPARRNWPARIVESFNCPVQDFLSFTAKTVPCDLSLCRSGFLDIGTESAGRVLWNRRWCVLDGDTVYLYCDAMQEHLGQSSTVKINLRNALNDTVAVADRTQGPRSTCLVLDTAKAKCLSRSDDDDGELRFIPIRHLIRADTTHDLRVWNQDLNLVLKMLASWDQLPYTKLGFAKY